jgi:hypothetical protein
MGLYVWGAIILAVLGFVVWLYRTGKSSGEDSVVVDAQKEVIDGQADIQAARVATADPGNDRADRLRDRFTRK